MSESKFPYPQRRLENDLVTIIPFDPSIHTSHMVKTLNSNPSIYTYLALPPLTTDSEFLFFYNKYYHNSEAFALYVVYDTSTSKDQTDSNYAGILSLNDTSLTEANTEVGIITFPAFQRTHVTSNALGLLLLYLLDPPSQGGLGLRRVVYKAAADNSTSRRLAQRFGFELEGILRWVRLARVDGLDVGELEARNGTTGEKKGQHTAVHSIVWDEWEAKRPGVIRMMERR